MESLPFRRILPARAEGRGVRDREGGWLWKETEDFGGLCSSWFLHGSANLYVKDIRIERSIYGLIEGCWVMEEEQEGGVVVNDEEKVGER